MKVGFRFISPLRFPSTEIVKPGANQPLYKYVVAGGKNKLCQTREARWKICKTSSPNFASIAHRQLTMPLRSRNASTAERVQDERELCEIEKSETETKTTATATAHHHHSAPRPPLPRLHLSSRE